MATTTYESTAEIVECFKRQEKTVYSESFFTSRFLGGVQTTADVLSLAEHGWDYEIDETLAIADRITERVADRIQHGWQRRRDVSGGCVDVAAWRMGVPEHMIDRRRTPMLKAGKVVTLVVSSAATSIYKADDLVARGRVYIALVSALQRLGYSVDLWIDATTDDRVVTKVHVMRPGEVLDPQRLTYWLAHPTMHRGMVFAARREDKDAKRLGYLHTRGGGYGRSSSPLASNWPEDAVIVDGSFYGIEDTEAKVLAELAKLGITPND